MCFKVEVEGCEWDSCDDGVQCPVSVCVVRMFFLVLLNQFHFFWINKNETATPMKVRPAQNTSGTRRLPVGAVPDYAAAIERHGRVGVHGHSPRVTGTAAAMPLQSANI